MCTCTSCKATDTFANGSFADWPRGNPAGRKSASEYAAHVRYGQSGGVQRAIPAINADPVSFYGLGASTRAQVIDALRRTFEEVHHDTAP